MKLGYSIANYGFHMTTVLGNLQVRYGTGTGNLPPETSRSEKCHDKVTDMSQTSTKDTLITETAKSLSSYHSIGP
eukprot:scaffold8217_cov75-Attheya_sp.AAC.1